jgi:hypothetical protein
VKRRLNNLVRWTVSVMGLKRYAAHVGELIGCAGCSTVLQDLAAQREALAALGVREEVIYLDRGLTGTARARPGLDQALAAVRSGDTLVVPQARPAGPLGARRLADRRFPSSSAA